MLELQVSDLKTLYTEEQLQTRIKELADELNAFYKGDEVYLIAVLKGSVYFAIDLSKRLTMPICMEFIRLSSYGHGFKSSGKVNAVDISLPESNGNKVLIVEDIIDTGLTAKFLLDFIDLNFKTKSTKFCSLLDKKVSRQTDVDADYHGFIIDNKFVVGYGLDYMGFYRNLPYIGYVENADK